ncbi:MAG TPA: Ser-Thr-rich GPI-anchored membrane family protein [Cyclobacteriaceae bacterium]|nr:Ser-Thr-rich GPI-anchored membrane family protein [Cyclobacteriaceae bacterium]
MVCRIIRKGIICVAIFFSGTLYAQRFENVRAVFSNGTVVITYDITAAAAGQKFNVEIFGSHNNYSVPLKAVTGDVGANVNAGLNRQVQWNAAAELGTYSGDVVFRLKGSLAPVPFSFVGPTSVRRGKNAKVKWVGGPPNQQVKLEVIQNGNVVNSITTGTNNTGEYAWSVPPDLAKGDYNLRITGGGETAQSNTVKVKSKLPILLIAAPVVVVGVLIAVLAKKGPGTDNPPNNTTSDELPDAPGPK